MEYKFSCEKCSYFTNNKQHFEKHNSSKKHNNGLINNIIQKTFECNICNNKYKNHSGLWKHKKICIEIPKNVTQKTKEKLFTIESINELVNDKNNMDILTKILYDGLNNYEILENKLVQFSNNTTTNNEVITYKEIKDEIKEEIKDEIKDEIKEEIKEEIREEMNDKLIKFYINFVNTFCKNNVNYYDFINELQITHSTREKFAIEFEQPIIDVLNEAFNKVGIDNSFVYCARNTIGSPFIILNLDEWRLFPYNENTREAIKEISEPLSYKIQTELDKICDEATKKRNGYKQHYNKLLQKEGLKDVLNDGIYQRVEVTVKDIKKIITRKALV